MTPAKQCNDRFEDIVALVMGELNSPAARELQVHIAVCDKCRVAHDALVEEEREVRSGFEALCAALNRSRDQCLRNNSTDQEFVSAYPTTISLKR